MKQTVYFSVHSSDDYALFNAMFKDYSSKIIIPEQSKDANSYFFLQDDGVYLFLDDMRNPKEIINQKLDEVEELEAYYNGWEITFRCKCVSGKTWKIRKIL